MKMMMTMMTNMKLRAAPILTLALASLFLQGRAVMAQYDVGTAVRTAIVTTTLTGPPNTTSSTAQVIFYHEQVSGSYDVDYYYAGCVNQIPIPTPAPPTPTPTMAAITNVVGDQSTSFDVSADITAYRNTCGPSNTVACAVKTTYSYILQKLSEITDSDIKTETTLNGVTTTTVKFCIRHRMLDANNNERGYKEGDMTFTWNTNSGFSGTVITNENGPNDETVNVGNVAVTVARCVQTGGIPTVYQQGEVIQLCVSASVTGSTATAAVTIVKVNTLRFWIDNNLQGVNGIYDVGETTQVGMAGALPQGTTTITPTGAGALPVGTAAPVYCTENLSGWTPSVTKGCVLSTFLGAAFFGPANQNVRYAGTVTIEFGDGNNRIRRVLSLRGRYRSLALQVGDQFDKPYSDALEVAAAAGGGSSTCSCSGFFLFKIFCWIFRCLLGFN